MGSMLVGFSEGLQLGKKAGLDQNQILEVVSLGAIASQLFTVKGPGMIQGSV
jgi:3-hydroxyisobutyrate dehydrogenase-like beta-hydroxyacid dehydrogenase